jgi:hypothetical protein
VTTASSTGFFAGTLLLPALGPLGMFTSSLARFDFALPALDADLLDVRLSFEDFELATATATASASASTVPEPAKLPLLGAGLAVVGGRVRQGAGARR